MSDIVATNQTILVVGGGISGMTAALEAAEVGKQVIVIEKRHLLLVVVLPNFINTSLNCVSRPVVWKSTSVA